MGRPVARLETVRRTTPAAVAASVGLTVAAAVRRALEPQAAIAPAAARAAIAATAARIADFRPDRLRIE